jgi:hypothetical protein
VPAIGPPLPGLSTAYALCLGSHGDTDIRRTDDVTVPVADQLSRSAKDQPAAPSRTMVRKCPYGAQDPQRSKALTRPASNSCGNVPPASDDAVPAAPRLSQVAKASGLSDSLTCERRSGSAICAADYPLTKAGC